jgi:hypothetical protein
MARRDYRGDTGKKLPGVTNIIDVLAKPALTGWGYKQGLWNYEQVTENIMGRISLGDHDGTLVDNIKQIISDFPIRKLYDKRDEAADAGTLAHSMVEVYLKNEGYVDLAGKGEAVVAKATACFGAFKTWATNHQFKLVESEKALVSKLGYGGTIDIGAVVGDLNIVDIKTSSGIYFSMRVQVAAYGLLWNENNPDNPIKGYRILQLGAEGDFHEGYWPNLDHEAQVFLNALNIYQILKETGQKL